jgi:hypothetical protein
VAFVSRHRFCLLSALKQNTQVSQTRFQLLAIEEREREKKTRKPKITNKKIKYIRERETI